MDILSKRQVLATRTLPTTDLWSCPERLQEAAGLQSRAWALEGEP